MKNLMTQFKKEILLKVEALKYKDEEVTLTGVYPSLLEEIFNCEMEIDGGRDFDYHCEFRGYEFSGSAYYGNCTVTKLTGKEKPKEDLPKQENVYTRTSFVRQNRLIENVPPVVDCTEETLKDLVNQGILHLYYIAFNNGSSRLIPFYAKKEYDVRLRALSIWNCYDDIMDEALVEKLKIKYQDRFSSIYLIDDKKYVLDWNFETRR